MKECKRIFIQNRILILINFGVLCFLCGNLLRKYRTVNMGIWGYMLSILTNHYYILYCVFPILLITTARHIRSINDIEIIRYNNAFEEIKISTKSFIQGLTLYMVSHLVIAFIIGIRAFGLSIKQKNIEVAVYDELIEILNMYIQYFDNSLFGVIANVVYFLFGFTVLVALLSYVNYRYKYKNMIVLSILIYIFTFIGFKTEAKTILPLICFDNYILLHHGLFVNGTEKFILTILFGVFTIWFCFGKRFKFDYSSFNGLIISRREKFISVIVVIVLFLLELLKSARYVDFNFKDVIILALFGTNKNHMSFISWLRLSILYLTPLFFIGMADSRMKKYGQSPILIRIKNKLDFECKLTREYIEYICLYIVFVYVLGNIFYFMGNADIRDEVYWIRELNIDFTYGILNVYFIIFLINLIFDFVIFKIIAKLTNEVISFLTILFCKFIFYMFPILNLFNLNFGMVNLFDEMKNKYELVIKVGLLLIVSIIYFIVVNARRLKYGNYKN